MADGSKVAQDYVDNSLKAKQDSANSVALPSAKKNSINFNTNTNINSNSNNNSLNKATENNTNTDQPTITFSGNFTGCSIQLTIEKK